MSVLLNPIQEEQVRAIVAEMIGQALRDIRPDSGQPTYWGDTAGPIGSVKPQAEAELRLACLRLALDERGVGLDAPSMPGDILASARQFYDFVSERSGERLGKDFTCKIAVSSPTALRDDLQSLATGGQDDPA